MFFLMTGMDSLDICDASSLALQEYAMTPQLTKKMPVELSKNQLKCSLVMAIKTMYRINNADKYVKNSNINTLAISTAFMKVIPYHVHPFIKGHYLLPN